MKKLKSKCKSSACVIKPFTGSSVWFTRIDQLGDAFEAYQCAADPVQKERLRDKFYQELWELAKKRSKNILYSMSSKGDPTTDAMDITGLFVEGMVKQEMNRKGLFDPTPRSPSQLRGYLSHTIGRGVSQQAGRFFSKQGNCVSLDESVLESAVATQDADCEQKLMDLAGKITKVIKQQKIPTSEIGTTPVDLVLQMALSQKICQGGLLKGLLPQAGQSLRTQQRREKKFRDDLRRELQM